MATPATILAEFKLAVDAITLVRDPTKTWVAAPSSPKDPTSPAPKDSFFCSLSALRSGPQFGRSGSKQNEMDVLVELNHAPIGDLNVIEAHVAAEMERVFEVLETRTWSTSGVEAVFLEPPARSNRVSATSFISELLFRVIYTGDIAS